MVALVVAMVVALGAGCAAPKPRQSAAVAGPWTTVAAAPASLTEVAVAVHDGRIWVAGGLRQDGGADDGLYVFDPSSGLWADGPDLPEPIHHAALIADGTGLVLIGGFGAGGGPTAAVHRLDDGAETWTEDIPLPEPRAAGAATFDGARILYAGGVGPSEVASEVFALAGDEWRRIGRLSKAREHLAAASDGAGRTFVLGGRVGGLGGNLGTVDLVEGDAVRALGDLPTPRGGVGAFWWPALGACLAGGESPGGTNPEVECIAPDGTMARLPDLEVARHGVGAAVVDGTAYVVLGGRSPGLFTSDVTEVLALP